MRTQKKPVPLRYGWVLQVRMPGVAAVYHSGRVQIEFGLVLYHPSELPPHINLVGGRAYLPAGSCLVVVEDGKAHPYTGPLEMNLIEPVMGPSCLDWSQPDNGIQVFREQSH